MISTKLFKRVVLASALAFLPLGAFAEGETDVNYDTTSAFYVKGFYNAGYVGSNDFENSGTSGVAAVGTTASGSGSVVQGSVNGEYEPDYELNFLGGGLALGYSYGGIRVELEGLFTGDIEMDEDAASNGKFYATTKVPSDLATAANHLDGISTVAVGPVHNNKFSYMAGFLNAYYDISINSTTVPYIGGGIGIAEVTFNGDQKVKSYPMALQGKIGASFNASGFTGIAMMPYVGYRLLYLMKTEADDSTTGLPVLRNDGTNNISTPVEGINYKMENSYMAHNLEVGVMIPLSA